MPVRFICVIWMLCFCCTFKATAASEKDTTQLIIVNIGEQLPEGAAFIGKIKAGDISSSRCDYDSTLESAKEKTIKKGGNVLRITKVSQPDGLHSCYRIYAEVYQIPNLPVIRDRLNNQTRQRLLADTASYALLYVYSPSTFGSTLPYNLHMDDSVICRMINGRSFIIKVDKPGKKKIWARTEVRDEVEIDVQAGKIYFIKCHLGIGIMLWRPHLKLMDAYIGLMEFEAVGKKPPKVRKDEVY